MLGEDEGRLVAVPNGHEAGKVVRNAIINSDFAFQNVPFLDVTVGNVLKYVARVGQQRLVNQRVVAPIVDVEANGSCFSVELQRRNA